MAGSEKFMHFDEVLAGKSGFKFNRCFGLDYVSRFHGLVAASICNSARLRLRLRIVICESVWKQEWFWTPITYLLFVLCIFYLIPRMVFLFYIMFGSALCRYAYHD